MRERRLPLVVAFLALAAALPRPLLAGGVVGIGTPTVPTATATATPNSYCAADETESVYTIATGNDDGQINQNSTGALEYPPVGEQFIQMNTVDFVPRRRYTSAEYGYAIWNAFWRWNISLPDNITVTHAYFVPSYDAFGIGTNGCADSLNMVVDWHLWTTLSASDYSEAPPAPSDSTYAATKDCGTVPAGYTPLRLTHLSNIPQSGYMGLRAQMETRPSDAAPTGDNFFHIHPFEDLAPAKFAVCYQAAPTPTPTVPTPTGTPTITPTPTPTATATSTPGGGDCCQCAGFCAAPIGGTCGGCTVVFGTSCTSGGLCATPTPRPCKGDCNSDHQVTVDEILTMVNIALGNTPLTLCNSGDANHDLQITVDEILTAVYNTLNGCPQ